MQNFVTASADRAGIVEKIAGWVNGLIWLAPNLAVLGGVQKMSTLVQWGKFQIMDAEAGRVVFERLVTLRGDSDEAFVKAEAFVAREILDPEKGLATAAT